MNAEPRSTTGGVVPDGAELPAVLAAHLSAHAAHDAERELACYAEQAAVTDEGRTYRGRAEIRAWLARAASQYTYTSTLTAVRQDAADRWTAVHHLEGDFPGGVVDLSYDYTLNDDRITTLTIAP